MDTCNFRTMCILCTPQPIYQSTYWLTPDISTNTQLICQSTYWPTLVRYNDRDMLVDISTDISTEILAEWWSTYQLTASRYLTWYSGQHSANTLTIDCRQNISQLSVVISVKSLDCQCWMYKLYITLKNFWRLYVWMIHVPQIQLL